MAPRAGPTSRALGQPTAARTFVCVSFQSFSKPPPTVIKSMLPGGQASTVAVGMAVGGAGVGVEDGAAVGGDVGTVVEMGGIGVASGNRAGGAAGGADVAG